MKIHRSECQAFHVRTLSYQGFVCFNLCGAGVGHHGPLGHDSVQEVCFYPTTQDSFFLILLQLIDRKHGSLSVGEAILVP